MNDERDENQSLIQGDLSMNLFMVLLTVLATLSISIVAIVQDGFKINSKNDSTDALDLALVPGWSPVQSINPRIIVRDGYFMRLDLSAFASDFANGRVYAEEIPGFDNSNPLPNDPEPTAYRLAFLHGPGAFPEDMIAWKLSFSALGPNSNENIPPEILNEIMQYSRADIHIYPNTEQNAWDFVAFLYQNRIGYRLLFRKKNLLQFGRSSKNFSFEETYK